MTYTADDFHWPTPLPFSLTALPDGSFALCGPMQPSRFVLTGERVRSESLGLALVEAANAWWIERCQTQPRAACETATAGSPQ